MRHLISTIVMLMVMVIAAPATADAPTKPFEVTGHKGLIVFIGFSADSKTLTTIDDGGLVRSWDALTGKLLSSRTDALLPLEYPHPTAKDAGHRLHAGLIEKYFPARSFTAEGSVVAGLTKAGTVRVRDLATGKERELRPDDGLVFCGVALSPDGKMVATWAARVNEGPTTAPLQFWTAATGKLLRTADRPKRVRDSIDFEILKEPSPPIKMLFTPDGKTLVTATEEIRFWDVATGRERAGNSFYGGSGLPLSVSFTPDSRAVAVGVMLGGIEGAASWTQIFDTATGKQLAFLTIRGDVEAGPGWFLPGGRIVATQKPNTGLNADDVIHLWDARSWEKTVRLDGCFAAASPDGKVVLTLVPRSGQEHKVLTAWDAATGARLRWLDGDWLPWLPDLRPGAAAAFSPDGTRLAAVEVRNRKSNELSKIDMSQLVVRVVPTTGAPWKDAAPLEIAPLPRTVDGPIAAPFPREVVPTQAELLLRAMDERIAAAKTLRIEYAIGSADSTIQHGTLLLATGNRFREEVKMAWEKGPTLRLSDGMQLFARPTRFGLEDAAFVRIPLPEWHTEMFLSSLGLGGIYVSQTAVAHRWRVGDDDTSPPRPSKAKYLPNEKVNGVGARVVEYDLAGWKMKVWIDAKTGLPVRREMIDADNRAERLIETYAKFEIDPKLDDKLFELPK